MAIFPKRQIKGACPLKNGRPLNTATRLVVYRHRPFGTTGINYTKQTNWFLAALSIVVGPLVHPLTFVKKWPLVYWKVIKTYFPTYLWDSSDICDSCGSSDSSESSDSSDSSDSSGSSDSSNSCDKKGCD